MGELYPPTAADYAAFAARGAQESADSLRKRIERIEDHLGIPHELPKTEQQLKAEEFAKRVLRLEGQDG